MSAERVEDAVKALALAHGFDAAGIARATPDPVRTDRLQQWLAAGNHGEMSWMAREAERRASPEGLWHGARSVIMLGVNYGAAGDPLAALAEPSRASLALYAVRKDYHDIIKGRLKAFGRELAARFGGDVRVFVDTAPVMEKPLAAAAGLGWQGKHSALVSRQFGAWLLLGAVYSTLALDPDPPEADHCGSCRACLDICPTNAFPAPYVLDSRACIAYLTIEHKGTIPRELRAKFGNRVFGCDDCLAICPWNKFAQVARETRLALREDLVSPALAELAALDDAAFRARFSGTPVKRTGRDRFVRNVLIAIGNSADRSLIPAARALADDASPLVRAMAIWALARLMDAQAFAELAGACATREPDGDVAAEWRHAGSDREASPCAL